MTVISGAKGYVNYGWETVYGTETASYDKCFGHIKSASINQSNNTQKIYAIGDVEAKATVAGTYEGSIDVEFIPTDFYFLKGVFGSVLDDGVGPYTHTYPDTTSAATRKAGYDVFTTASVQVGLDLGTDSVISCLGGAFSSMTLSASVGEPITCKLTIPFKTVAEDSTLETPATTSEAPFMFAQATLEVPNSTAITNCESVEITVNRNAEKIYAIGDRTPKATIPKQTDYEIKITVPYEAAATFMESFWGSGTGPSTTTVSEVATAELTITNGGASTALRSLVFLISNLQIDSDTLNVTANEVVKEDITLLGRTITSAIYTNNTASAL